jgi:predicted RNase H-like HicB family nuclease/uncharacterized damage-inducible protein DinB
MPVYKLYLESGPQHKKTMVHVPELLGCVVTGPTTEATLERTPEMIRAFLRFVRRHGEMVDPDQDVQIEVAEHFTRGTWMGNGDPDLVLPSDLEPLTEADVEKYVRRLEGSRAELLALIEGLSDEQLTEKPEKGRPIRGMLEHIFGAEYSYVRLFGKLDGVPGPGVVENKWTPELLDWMAHVRASEIAKLRSLTPEERTEPIRGKRMASKIVRRMLEHEWEHLVEMSERLGKPL